MGLPQRGPPLWLHLRGILHTGVMRGCQSPKLEMETLLNRQESGVREKQFLSLDLLSETMESSMLSLPRNLVVIRLTLYFTGITSTEIKRCFGVSLGIEYSEKIQTRGSLSLGPCEKSGDGKLTEDQKAMGMEDFISRVRGGSSGWGGGLTQESSIITYRSWGRSLKYNPAVIDFEIRPIHEILRHTNLGSLETKRQNLRRALDQYLMEFNACRCGPCFNNGEPILEGTSCKCLCPVGRQGLACEQMQSEALPKRSWCSPNPQPPPRNRSKLALEFLNPSSLSTGINSPERQLKEEDTK